MQYDGVWMLITTFVTHSKLIQTLSEHKVVIVALRLRH